MPIDYGIGPLIPNNFKPLHPADYEESMQREDLRPAELGHRDMVKYILRSGEQGKAFARRLWWGDRDNEDGAIVAYKRIKLENPWQEWGLLFDRGEELPRAVGSNMPAGLDPSALVKVWLRNYPRPEVHVRRASAWDWNVSGENGGDIIKYRLDL